MTDGYTTALKYAGNDAFEPEYERYGRGELSWEEYELLTQDETYVRLAHLRYLAQRAENEIAGGEGVPNETALDLLDAHEAHIRPAVAAYVDAWLDRFRSEERERASDAPAEVEG